MSYFTLRRLSKKCRVAEKPHDMELANLGSGHVGDEKAPAIDGRGTQGPQGRYSIASASPAAVLNSTM